MTPIPSLALCFSLQIIPLFWPSVAGNDPLLERVQCWIRYSIHLDHVDRAAFRHSPPDAVVPDSGLSGVTEDSVPLDAGLSRITRDSVLGTFNAGQCVEFADQNELEKVITKIIDCEALIKGDLKRWGKGRHEAKDWPKSYEYSEEGHPKWLKMVAKIDRAIGWHHFDILCNSFLSPNVGINSEGAVFGRISQFCARANMDLANVWAQIKIASAQMDRFPLEISLLYGTMASKSLFHLILYESLIKTLAPRPVERVEKPKCRPGMPRRDYVLYWLSTMFDHLKQHAYRPFRDQFIKFTFGHIPHWPPQIGNALRDLVKYVSVWDKSLKMVEQSENGARALDETIDLIGPMGGEAGTSADGKSVETHYLDMID